MALTVGGITWKSGWLKTPDFSLSKNASLQPETDVLRNVAFSTSVHQLRSHQICGQIYELICKTPRIDRDPTGTVRPDEEGERAALQIYQNITRQNPTWSTRQINEEFTRRVYSPQNRAKIQATFDLVKRLLSRWIDREPKTVFTLQEKDQLKARINGVQLQLPPPATLYEDEPDLLTESELIYERQTTGETALRVGGAYIIFEKSWFNIIFSLAHELGHSIDPCEIRSAGMAFPAYDRLVGCFLDHRLIAMRNTRAECGPNDQLSETFADWVAVHITAEALSNYSSHLHGPQILHAAQNSVRDLCETEPQEKDESKIEFHPSSKIRIEEIFGKNPKIRKFLGCESLIKTESYCEFNPQHSAQPGGT